MYVIHGKAMTPSIFLSEADLITYRNFKALVVKR